MAKGLRSKSKRSFRTLKRAEVSKAPAHLEDEARCNEAMEAVLAAPKPEPPAGSGGDGGDGTAAAMGGVQQGEGAMAVDGAEGDGTTTSNPSKLLKKLRKQRFASAKGIALKASGGKKSRPLAGANQFHKKKKKRG